MKNDITSKTFSGNIELSVSPNDPIAWKLSMLFEAARASSGRIENIAGKYGYSREHFYVIKKAYDMIWSIVAEPEEGKVYTGKVVKLVDFGAFVNFFGKRDGLVHVSQIANKRLQHPNEALKEGQEVKVKLLGFDDRGKVRLGMKMVDQVTGEEIAETPAEG